MVLEKTLESPLDCKEIQPVNPKGNQSWIFIGKTDAEAEVPILWLPDSKNWLIGKDPDAGKDWRQGEKGTTEDKMVGWHHWLDGYEFEQTAGVGDGQGSLAVLQSMGSQRVGHDWGTELNFKVAKGTAAAAKSLQSCPTLCDPMDCSKPGSSFLHCLLEFALTHVHQVGDAIQPSHPLLSPSPLAFNLSQHQGLF